jgi:hypothetical protein
MRALVLVLFMLNLALYGWLRGMFGNTGLSGREPGRLEQQVAAERIRVLTDRDVQQLRRRAADAAPAPTAASAPPAGQAPDTSCLEITEFAGGGALARFRERLTEMKLIDKSSEQMQELAGWYSITLPAVKTRAEAEHRVEELRSQGERDALIVQLSGPSRFGIELGAFHDKDQARKQLARLERRGVKGARVADAPAVMQVIRVRLRGLDAAGAAQVEVLQKDFPQQKLQACAPAPAP